MGFLDNSGDIILDAVLTDHGRKQLSRGDGSFQITKFALGDEEIDYSLYNKTHPSGSAYYDLEILQTPVLEAFTDNAASMKTRLQTYTNLELLFLPVNRLNETKTTTERHADGTFYVAVNQETEDNGGSSTTKTGVARDSAGKERTGFIFGESLVGSFIKVDQGLDTIEISPKRNLDSTMVETSYIIQIDNRLGNIVSVQGDLASPDYHIAFYTLDLGDAFVSTITDNTISPGQVIQGPRGTSVEFRIQASMDLNTSSYLFTSLGSIKTLEDRSGTGSKSSVYYIDTNIRVMGVKTGCFVDIPVTYVRLV